MPLNVSPLFRRPDSRPAATAEPAVVAPAGRPLLPAIPRVPDVAPPPRSDFRRDPDLITHPRRRRPEQHLAWELAAKDRDSACVPVPVPVWRAPSIPLLVGYDWQAGAVWPWMLAAVCLLTMLWLAGGLADPLVFHRLEWLR